MVVVSLPDIKDRGHNSLGTVAAALDCQGISSLLARTPVSRQHAVRYPLPVHCCCGAFFAVRGVRIWCRCPENSNIYNCSCSIARAASTICCLLSCFVFRASPVLESRVICSLLLFGFPLLSCRVRCGMRLGAIPRSGVWPCSLACAVCVSNRDVLRSTIAPAAGPLISYSHCVTT